MVFLNGDAFVSPQLENGGLSQIGSFNELPDQDQNYRFDINVKPLFPCTSIGGWW
jgi:hypothetical protein